MCSLAVPAQNDLIAGRDHVIDGHPHVRERRSVHGRDALESVGAAEVTHLSREGGVVVEGFGGNELVDRLEVAGIEALLEELASGVGEVRGCRGGAGRAGHRSAGHVRPPPLLRRGERTRDLAETSRPAPGDRCDHPDRERARSRARTPCARRCTRRRLAVPGQPRRGAGLPPRLRAVCCGPCGTGSRMICPGASRFIRTQDDRPHGDVSVGG